MKADPASVKLKRMLSVGFRKMRKSIKRGKGLRRKSKRSRKSRVVRTPKIGGFLPLLLPVLGALGALAGGGASIAKTVIDAKNASKKLREDERHNKELEAIARGAGLFLKPYQKNFR